MKKVAEDNFKRMKNLFPNCEDYLDHITLKHVDNILTSIDRLRYVSKKLHRAIPTEKKELSLITDLDALMNSIHHHPVHVLNERYECQRLRGKIEQIK